VSNVETLIERVCNGETPSEILDEATKPKKLSATALKKKFVLDGEVADIIDTLLDNGVLKDSTKPNGELAKLIVTTAKSEKDPAALVKQIAGKHLANHQEELLRFYAKQALGVSTRR